jgi:hypothetical protein
VAVTSREMRMRRKGSVLPLRPLDVWRRFGSIKEGSRTHVGGVLEASTCCCERQGAMRSARLQLHRERRGEDENARMAMMSCSDTVTGVLEGVKCAGEARSLLVEGEGEEAARNSHQPCHLTRRLVLLVSSSTRLAGLSSARLGRS